MSDVLSMSDEDFLKQALPAEESAEPVEPTPETVLIEPAAQAQDPAPGSPESVAPAAESAAADPSPPPATGQATEGETTAEPSEAAPQAPAAETAQAGDPAADKPAAQPDAAAPAPNYEDFYKKIMAPFKANGKTIELRSPEEAIQLMQMGANYTKKMQDIVPHRKVLMMLENNGLLDEGKLSFLIDLHGKNPEAIKKLVKDAGIDPLEIDTQTEPAYQAGNHRVSDEQVAFNTVLDEMKSSETGLKTLQVINGEWDDASKDVLWQHPAIIGVIHQQRESGIYDRIAAEVHRQRTLGAIPAQVPFLQAYKAIGDQLQAAGALADLQAPAPQSSSSSAYRPSTPTIQQAPAAPVATRTAAPKPVVANGDKAQAASPTRTTAKPAQAFVNPLAMSDDEFLKQMANRV